MTVVGWIAVGIAAFVVALLAALEIDFHLRGGPRGPGVE